MSTESNSSLRTVALALGAGLVTTVVAGLFFTTNDKVLVLSESAADAEQAKPAAMETKKSASDAGKKRSSTTREHSAARLKVELEARIALAQKKWKSTENDWLSLKTEASSQMALMRLTGDYRHLTLAEERLTQAFKRAPARSGPWIAQAKLKLTLHQLVEAEAALASFDQVATKARAHASAAEAIAGDIALQRGDYNRAAVHFQRAVKIMPIASATAKVRLASIHEQLGEKDKTETLLDELVAVPGPQAGLNRSWLLLRRGIFELDRGDVKKALTWFKRADKAFPGWYLVQEHIAESNFRLGDLDAAEALYRSVLEKNPNPEFHAALAGVLEAQGKAAEAQAAEKKAGEGFADLMRTHPEAMMGHALDWFLEGPQVAKALELAQANHRLRPSGKAKTKLAMAQIRIGDDASAQKIFAEVKAGVHRSSAFYMVEAYLLRRQGQPAAAAKAALNAEALERGATEAYSWLKPIPG